MAPRWRTRLRPRRHQMCYRSSAPRARTQEVSRHIARAPIRSEAAPRPKSSASETITPVLKLKISDSKYATTELNVRTKPQDDAHVVGVCPCRHEAVGHLHGHRRIPVCVLSPQGSLGEGQVPLRQEADVSGCVSVGSGGISGAPCPSGSSVESGLTPDARSASTAPSAIAIHRSRNFLGRRTSSGYHGQGRAVDCMISDSTIWLGDR